MQCEGDRRETITFNWRRQQRRNEDGQKNDREGGSPELWSGMGFKEAIQNVRQAKRVLRTKNMEVPSLLGSIRMIC